MKRHKRIIDTVLTACLVIVAATGIMLHLKKHGIVIEPRAVLKAIHYYVGYLFSLCALLHVQMCLPMLQKMKAKPWFRRFTWALLGFGTAVLLTGTVKLLSPVKIPHIGLWHFWLGLFMIATAARHLWTALPWLLAKWRKP